MPNLTYKLIAGAIGVAAAFAAQKSVTLGWRSMTGQEPPDPNDPEVPAAQAIAWVVASAIALGVAQVVANRLAQRQLEKAAGAHLH